jgi:hypothetical protein
MEAVCSSETFVSTHRITTQKRTILMDFARAVLVCGFVHCAAGLNIGRKICREFACLVQDSQEHLQQGVKSSSV